MQTALRKMGNSTGIILPKPILTALGVASGARLELEVDNGRVIVTPIRRKIREGWADAAAALAATAPTADEEAWLNLTDDGDADWTW